MRVIPKRGILEVSEDRDAVNIDIHIPGVTKNKVAVGEYWIKESVKVSPKEEIVHVILPFEKSCCNVNEKSPV